MNSAADSAQEKCRFLTLPPELRNHIYELALVDTNPISIPWMYMLRSKEPSEPSLLRTCHRIRDEALPIFYSSNTFETSIIGLGEWFRRLPDVKLGMLENVRVIGYLGGMFEEAQWREKSSGWAAEIAKVDGRGLVEKSALLFPVAKGMDSVGWLRSQVMAATRWLREDAAAGMSR
ncbi:hypothetical protein B0A55_03254 [Friedmanniomyces simplex]|uniref:2EXR domain-containing protein n=1 Tax=Friedmanniomyces simplex TaxID=329884 RepID=A0A4U0XIL2_9PEZI|nr:hypothetical protein B0A55_04564 [Friedmanniomyces simplex]TKA76143.1 hypothetical protein B0A55_03254 [Friedmanniomyces simplex]